MPILDFLSGLEGLMVLLFVLGIVLVVVEIIMPGFGVAGGLGMLSLLVGVVVAAQVVSPLVLTLMIAVVLILITGMLIWLYNSATKGGRISKLLLLNSKTGKEEGYNSVKDLRALIGREGIALTILRPTGTGEFGEMRLDVIADGEFIAKGSPIKIIDIEGFRILVAKI